MVISLRTYSTVNLPLEKGLGATHSCDTKMSARVKLALDIDTERWEDIAVVCSSQCCFLYKQLKEGKDKITNLAVEKRAKRKENT